MKKNILSFLCLYVLWLVACTEDKGNYDYIPVENMKVNITDGVEEEYVRDAMQQLQITPVFEREITEQEYDFCWYIYPRISARKADTLSYERNLDYLVTLGSGDYNLIYRVRNKATGVCLYQKILLTVASIYNNMWVIAKNDGNYSDIDVVTSDNKVLTNVLAAVNQGDRPSGSPIKVGYIDGYRHTFTNEDGTVSAKRDINGMVMMTSEEVRIYDMDNMGVLKSYKDCFFGEIPAGKPNWCCPYNSGNYALIIGNRVLAYNSSVGSTGKFSPKAGNYQCGKNVIPSGISSKVFLFFDEESQSLMKIAGGDEKISDFTANPEAAKSCKNMGCKAVYMEDQYVFPNKQSGLALFQDENNGKFYSAELASKELNSGMNPIMSFREIPAGSKVVSSDVFSANQYVSTLYFVNSQATNELWSYDFTTQRERKQVTFGVGEKIAYAKHVVVVTKVISATEREYMSVMSVVTNCGGKWKLYVMDFVGETQDIEEGSKPSDPPTGDGNGQFVLYKGSTSRSI